MDQLGIDIQKEVSIKICSLPFAFLTSHQATPTDLTPHTPLHLRTTRCDPPWTLQEPTIHQEVKEKQTLLQALPIGDEELYTRFKKLEAHREFLNLQEASDTALPNDRGYVLTGSHDYLLLHEHRSRPRCGFDRNTFSTKPTTSVENSSVPKKKSNGSNPSLSSSASSSKRSTVSEVSSARRPVPTMSSGSSPPSTGNS